MCIYIADIGYFKKSPNKIHFVGGSTMNGVCYKNLNAWYENKGVIYIGEYDLQELEDDFNSGKDIDTSKLWTKTTWTKWVKDYIADNYKNEVDIDKILNDDEFIEYLALDCLNNADWQDLSTLLNEYEYNNDWVYDNWEWYQKDRKK